MMQWTAAAAALAALAIAPTATAAPPASTEANTQARQAADSIIAAAQVGDLFENATKGVEPWVGHRASGMVYSFGEHPDEWVRDDVVVFPSGLPRGDDVGCNIHAQGFLVSLDVSRIRPTPGLDAITADYVRSVMALHPKARHYTGVTVEPRPAPGSTFPTFRTVRFVFSENGGLFSRLSVAVVNGWVIEERVTGPLADASFGDLLSGVEMIGAIDSVRGGELLKQR